MFVVRKTDRRPRGRHATVARRSRTLFFVFSSEPVYAACGERSHLTNPLGLPRKGGFRCFTMSTSERFNAPIPTISKHAGLLFYVSGQRPCCWSPQVSMLFARRRRGRPARRMTNNALTMLARWRLTPSGIAKFLWGKPATRNCGLRLRTPLMASLKRSNIGDALQPLALARQCHNHAEEPGRKQSSAYP